MSIHVVSLNLVPYAGDMGQSGLNQNACIKGNSVVSLFNHQPSETIKYARPSARGDDDDDNSLRVQH